MTMTYLIEVKNTNPDHFCRLHMIISQTVTGRANLNIANTWEELLIGFLIGIFAFDLG